MKRFIALALGLALFTPLAASADDFGPPIGARPFQIGRFYNGIVVGRVASKQGSSLTMQNGRTIFLKHGTVINGNLQAGVRIAVRGTGAGNGNINATNITVIRGGGYRY